MYRALAWMPCLAAIAISGLPGCASPSLKLSKNDHRPQRSAIQHQLMTVARSYELQGETHRARQLYSELAQQYPRFTEAHQQLARLDAATVIDPTERIARQHAIAQAFEREGRPEIAQRFYANLGAGMPPAGIAPAPADVMELPTLAANSSDAPRQSSARPNAAPAPKQNDVAKAPALSPASTAQKADVVKAAQQSRKPRGEQKLIVKGKAAPSTNDSEETQPSKLARLSNWLLGRPVNEIKAAKPQSMKPTTAKPIAAAKPAPRRQQVSSAELVAPPAPAVFADATRPEEGKEAATPAWHQTASLSPESDASIEGPVMRNPLPLPDAQKPVEPTVPAEIGVLVLDEPVEEEKPVDAAIPEIHPAAPAVVKSAAASEKVASETVDSEKADGATFDNETADSETEVVDTLPATGAPQTLPAELEKIAIALPPQQADLVRRLGHDDARERTLAAYLLGKSENSPPAVVPALQWQFQNEADTRVKIHLAEAIAKLDPADEAGMDALITMLADDSERVRWLAVIALGDVLSSTANDESEAADAERTGRIAQGLTETLKDETPRVRSMAALALAHLRGSASGAIPELTKLLDDEDAEVREAADAALACIKANQAADEAKN